MSDEQKLGALLSYFELMNMNGAARIYRSARELGIFDAVGNGPVSAGEVAATCSLQEGPVRLLLDGLCSIGTLTSEANS